MSLPIIFLGPSLPVAEARTLLEADYRPPLQRGDLPAALRDNPPLIGIIDGQFYQALAVSPGEVLAALATGTPLLGASSMGALRAAELHTRGMIGVGRIFEWYRDGIVEADDEVALLYDSESFRPLSEPLVNIRHALEQATLAGILTPAQAQHLIALAQEMFFPERTYPRLLAHATLPPATSAALTRYLAENQHDLKGNDARLLLHHARALLAPPS